MMFDDNNTQNDSVAPTADGQLAHDDAGANPPALASDTAGEYMLEDGTPATSNPAPDSAATDDSNDSSGSTNDDADANGAPPKVHNTDELLDIKRQALQQLTPLVGHLDQSPDEKFRTTMMMIQASDNDALIKQAYEAAQAIADEKARAQALLDVINEINYFTQHSTA